VTPESETVEEATVCSEWGTANAGEKAIHGGASAFGGGADEVLPECIFLGGRTGCATAVVVSTAVEPVATRSSGLEEENCQLKQPLIAGNCVHCAIPPMMMRQNLFEGKRCQSNTQTGQLNR
jgi:hypothetical protein